MRRRHSTLIGLLFVSGCSTFTPYESVVYPSDAVGETGPLKVGSSTRTDVVAALGEPGYRSSEDREFGYLFAPAVGTRKGVLIGPCSQLRPGEREVSGMDDVWLAFDASGILRRYDKGLVKKHGGSDANAWQAFQKAS